MDCDLLKLYEDEIISKGLNVTLQNIAFNLKTVKVLNDRIAE